MLSPQWQTILELHQSFKTSKYGINTSHSSVSYT